MQGKNNKITQISGLALWPFELLPLVGFFLLIVRNASNFVAVRS